MSSRQVLFRVASVSWQTKVGCKFISNGWWFFQRLSRFSGLFVPKIKCYTIACLYFSIGLYFNDFVDFSIDLVHPIYFKASKFAAHAFVFIFGYLLVGLQKVRNRNFSLIHVKFWTFFTAFCQQDEVSILDVDVRLLLCSFLRSTFRARLRDFCSNFDVLLLSFGCYVSNVRTKVQPTLEQKFKVSKIMLQILQFLKMIFRHIWCVFPSFYSFKDTYGR